MGNLKPRYRLQLERKSLNFSIEGDRHADVRAALFEQRSRQRTSDISQAAHFDKRRRLGSQEKDLESRFSFAQFRVTGWFAGWIVK